MRQSQFFLPPEFGPVLDTGQLTASTAESPEGNSHAPPVSHVEWPQHALGYDFHELSFVVAP